MKDLLRRIDERIAERKRSSTIFKNSDTTHKLHDVYMFLAEELEWVKAQIEDRDCVCKYCMRMDYIKELEKEPAPCEIEEPREIIFVF